MIITVKAMEKSNFMKDTSSVYDKIDLYTRNVAGESNFTTFLKSHNVHADLALFWKTKPFSHKKI